MKDIRLDPLECEHIKGINCTAKNCTYNVNECYCTADKINIGPISAHTMNETLCGTFKSKK